MTSVRSTEHARVAPASIPEAALQSPPASRAPETPPAAPPDSPAGRPHLPEGADASGLRKNGFETLAREFATLATAIEQRPPQVVEALEPNPKRALAWVIGVLCAIVIGGGATAWVMLSGPLAGRESLPLEVRQTLQDDNCATRVAALMNAVAAYRAQTGALPPSLTVLYPEFVSFPPVDAAINQPYGYEVVGDLVSISCPRAEPAAAPPA